MALILNQELLQKQAAKVTALQLRRLLDKIQLVQQTEQHPQPKMHCQCCGPSG